jgi:Ca-activated chloride channel homolog
MKKFILFVLSISLAGSLLYANGVGIINGQKGIYLRLDSTIVNVTVESQISTTVTTQYFTNIFDSATVKYAFPMEEQASAIKLRWKIGEQWFTASVSNSGQNTSIPGGGTPKPDLVSYLGATPLYFSIPQKIANNQSIAVELSYVEFLPYKFGNVLYTYPADYHLIQQGAVPLQKLIFQLSSPRTVDSLTVLSKQPVEKVVNSGNNASILINLRQTAAAENYSIQYTLDLKQLGLYAFSDQLPSSQLPDPFGGFFTFVAEPDPSATTNTIPKVFTLIIDQSGSMGGTKITQAKEAASFIVNNLNEGDKFNILAFSDDVSLFQNQHVGYSPSTRDAALNFISTLDATNGTNMSGAFDVAVPQFSSADDNAADIIVFFTDGQPTSGITDTGTLVDHIDKLIQSTKKNILLFCFGIGSDANQQLLTLFSSHNNGITQILGNDELYSSITSFYLTIRNPVLLHSHVSFSPAVVNEVYPDSLPNLYKGNQMIISGRYTQSGPMTITLNGDAFSKPVSYSYQIILTDSTLQNYSFLPKIWAKKKIESLMTKYLVLNPNSNDALTLKATIIEISKGYNIITSFTSFYGTGTSVEQKKNVPKTLNYDFELLGNYPNPFNPSTTIRFQVNIDYQGPVEIRIYNSIGQLVRTLTVSVRGQGVYEIVWNGRGINNSVLSSGVYLYAVQLNNTLLVKKMIMMK